MNDEGRYEIGEERLKAVAKRVVAKTLLDLIMTEVEPKIRELALDVAYGTKSQAEAENEMTEFLQSFSQSTSAKSA